MGFVKIFWKNNVQDAYSPKISNSGQIVSEILAQLCCDDSIQILLNLAWFIRLGTRYDLEGFVWSSRGQHLFDPCPSCALQWGLKSSCMLLISFLMFSNFSCRDIVLIFHEPIRIIVSGGFHLLTTWDAYLPLLPDPALCLAEVPLTSLHSVSFKGSITIILKDSNYNNNNNTTTTTNNNDNTSQGKRQ